MNGITGVSKCGKGRLIAPRFDHDDANGDPFLKAASHFAHDSRLRIPLVAAHPWPKDPARRKLWTAGALEERCKHLERGSFPQPEVDRWIRLARIERNVDPESVRIGLAHVEPGPP